jgi:hypothetical protein
MHVTISLMLSYKFSLAYMNIYFRKYSVLLPGAIAAILESMGLTDIKGKVFSNS